MDTGGNKGKPVSLEETQHRGRGSQRAGAKGEMKDRKTWVGSALYRSLEGLQLVSKCQEMLWRI